MPSHRGPHPMVEVMVPRFAHGTHVPPHKIDDICCHRVKNKREEFLVRWKDITDPGLGKDHPNQAFSWHPLIELSGDLSGRDSALFLVQQYIDAHVREQIHSRKRKRLIETDPQSRASPFVLLQANEARQVSPLAASSNSETSLDATLVEDQRDNYNCKLVVKGDVITAEQGDVSVDTHGFPTTLMLARAAECRTPDANTQIREEYMRKLYRASKGQPPLSLVNSRDESSPLLSFKFIKGYRYGSDVSAPDPSTLEGCGSGRRACRPNMGGDCGCEYTQDCECLEYAQVVEARLTDEERVKYEAGESTIGLPKKFPYSKGDGLLVSFYLDSRYPVYECNDRCKCGPNCKTRVVQLGRQVGLEIFKTADRGFGLRSMQPLKRGQFIDLYKGEVITVEEADRRRETASKDKESYFYALDKFPESCRAVNGQDALYEVDGEFMGGPTRFMNHSCEPNCRQFVVIYDKNNPYLYNLAFFAARDIAAGEELTFDYLDKDDEDPGSAEQGPEQSQGDYVKCKCGASKCRGRLWS